MSGKNISNNVNSVFYAESYHPIQAGSIDGTDIAPHDNAIYRAHLCSSAALYDPLGDPKLIGDGYCTAFVGRLSHLTTENSLRKAMSKYGRVKNLRLVRDIVTGASRGYAFVEYETEREMLRAYNDAHHALIDDSEVMVDYSRQQLMPGWIPRRLGGGLGGRKESGQIRFGGRERPFRAPLRPIPFDDLKRLGIPPPPEGRYMSRFQVPSPPRRPRMSKDRDRKRSSIDEELRPRSSSVELEECYRKRRSMDKEELSGNGHTVEREERRHKMVPEERLEPFRERTSHERESYEREYQRHRSSSVDTKRHHEANSPAQRESSHKRSTDVKDHSGKRDSTRSYRDEGSRRHHKRGSRSSKHKRRRSNSQDLSSGV